MQLRPIIAAGVSFALLTVAAMAAAHAPDMDPLGMVTGPKTGTYIAFGRDIARVAKEDGIDINVFDSEGSIDNIQRISSKEKVGLAIVQSDVLGFLKRSRNEGSQNIARKLRLVAPLYSEEVHILARSDIHSIADLAGRRVVVGAAGSGSMITAINIFSLLNITPAKFYEIDPPRGVVAVLNNEADAMVFVGGKPVKMFKNMEDLANIHEGPNAGKLAQVHFLPLTDPRLMQEYRPATLSNSDYNYVADDVPTVAVTAVLVAYDYTMRKGEYYHKQCQNMARLARALTNHLDELRATGHPKWKEVNLNAEVGIWKRDACTAEAFSPSGVPPLSESRENPLEKDLLGVIRGSAGR